MEIQYCSDLHLEFPENSSYLAAHPLPVLGEILILAGDIMPLHMVKQFSDFWDRLSYQYKHVFWVPGNHEFYFNDLQPYSGSFSEPIRKNVWLINNFESVIENSRFLFSTLWSNLDPARQFVIQQRMSDFHVIRFGTEVLTVNQYHTLFQKNKAFLAEKLAEPFSGQTLVITHHVPTLQHYPEQYKSSVINSAFATHLDDFILEHQPDFWIYGHHHCDVPAFSIGKTTLLTHQLGYVRYGEHGGFQGGGIVSQPTQLSR